MPALFTMQSTRPKASSAVCTMRLALAQPATLSVLASRVTAAGADLVHHPVGRALVGAFAGERRADVVHDDLRARGGHRERDLAPDAAARAGDDRYLVFQHAHLTPKIHIGIYLRIYIRMMSNCSCV